MEGAPQQVVPQQQVAQAPPPLTVEELQAQLQTANQQLQTAAAMLAQYQAAPGLPGHVKPPKPEEYSGGKGVTIWLTRMEQYFEAASVPPVAQVQYAGLLLTGAACTWWANARELARTGLVQLPATWEAFRAALCERFQPVTQEDAARQKMRSLVQTKSLQGYINTFQDFALQIPSMDDRTKMDNFIFGLKPECRTYVRHQRPATLADAVRWSLQHQASAEEERLAARRYRPGGQRHRDDDAAPMEVGYARGEQGDGGNKVRACWHCGQPGHVRARCPKLRKQGGSRKPHPRGN